MKYVLSIDPGMSTGITLGSHTAISPYERLAYWQIEGGLPGFRGWYADFYMRPRGSTPWSRWHFPGLTPIDHYELTLVCEKFVPLPMARSFKLAELEPIRIEGALEALGLDPVWQRPSAMVLAGGGTQAERKRNSDDVLRRGGLWLTGKDVGLKDANDVNASCKHALGYMNRIGHQPTIHKYLTLED